MDSITHIALGACVGEILLSKKLGKKALLWGIIAQNLPDIDTVPGLFMRGDRALLFHRGITHSLFFALVIGLLLAWLAKNIHRKPNISFATLAFFFCFQLGLHDLLDTCNSYGTGLLEPFSHHRFSINLLYVADPLFTIGLVIAALLLVFKSSNNKYRVRWASTAIAVSVAYLCFSAINKIVIDSKVDATIKQQNYFTTPAPFNNMLWYVVANADNGYYTGYSSIWDRSAVAYGFHPKNDSLLNKSGNVSLKNNLTTFADHYYTVTDSGKAIYVNILRFEQVQGWQNNKEPFALRYPLSAMDNENMIIQKGRLTGWNKKSFKLYLERIAGRQTQTK
ncbi:metal-dependent hydrolase [Mucilaginibacter sp. X5P1]|uniref:metal-dependent hydrolase n=1 Tax=Mucilaginibacter sp. X5P1 TaxID=2723088 RepID=UPI0016140E2F|nr:metal-dependent hydrolase [Mucilaginibacter sp. X5P1]MBB6141439.1 inner membrane protein [Mucilaginibacter sp. X5P1]